MFDNYVSSKQRRLPKWVVPVFATAIILHLCVLAGAVVHGYWAIEKLPLPKERIELAVRPPSPRPPPAKKGSPANKPKVDTPKAVKVTKDIIQPIKLDKPVEVAAADPNIGDPNGDENGDSNSTCTGPDCDQFAPPVEEPPPPPPPKKVEQPQIVPQVVLESQRISGDKMIAPDDITKTKIARDGKSRIVATFKMCLDTSGNVKQISLIKSSDYGEYDSKLKSGMHQWKYRPFMVNGKAMPVCTSVTFIYNQKN